MMNLEIRHQVFSALFLCLFIIVLLIAIISAQKEKPGTSVGKIIGIVLSVAYVLLAAFFFAASSESPFRWVPAFTGGGTIVLLCVYMYRLKDARK